MRNLADIGEETGKKTTTMQRRIAGIAMVLAATQIIQAGIATGGAATPIADGPAPHFRPIASDAGSRYRSSGPRPRQLRPLPSESRRAGFDWRGAGIGVAAGAGLVLILLGALLLVHRIRPDVHYRQRGGR